MTDSRTIRLDHDLNSPDWDQVRTRHQPTAAQYDELLQAIYGPVDLDAVAYALANEGRSWFDCDRVAVLRASRRRCQLLSVSGVDVISHRSRVCRALEDLASYVAASEEVLIHAGNAAQDSDELEQTIHRYVHESHARQLIALPLYTPTCAGTQRRGQLVGVLVLEQFTNQSDVESLQRRAGAVSHHFATALGHAVERADAPLAALSQRLGRWRIAARGRRFALWGGAALATTLLAAMCFVQAPLRVPARGELQPAIRQDLFAAEDGVVDHVAVDHGDAVGKDQLLIGLRQSELEYAFVQVDGQLRTAQQQQQSVAARRGNLTSSTAAAEDADRLAAEQQLLRQTIAGLQEQRRILQQRQEQLQLRGPFNGEVVTWNVRQRLLKRPVRRGQRLLSVVDPHGPWVAELKVADRKITHILQARHDEASELPVSFLLATDPATTYTGQVIDVARTTQSADDPTVLVTVRVDSDQIEAKRPGATVVARIACGQRSLAYIWFHDIADWARTHWWW